MKKKRGGKGRNDASGGVCVMMRVLRSSLAVVVVLAATLPTDGAIGSAKRERYRFRDMTSDAGLSRSRSTDSWGIAWSDFDRSGYPDLFVGHHGAGPRLYANEGGGTYRRLRYDFRRPTRYSSGDGDHYVDRHNCAWGEANGWGPPELYCTIGANEGTGVGPNQLLVFGRDGVRDTARRYDVADRYGRGRSVNWLDADSDGDLDLFVANFYRSGHPNVLFVNRRGGFARRDRGLGESLRSYGSSWADWDGDRDPDLVVTQWGAGAVAYQNRGGRFARVTLPHISGRVLMSLAWNDFNGDGWIDVHAISQTRSMILRNRRGSLRLVDSRPLTEGRMSTWFDLENDGDLDSFVVQGAAGVSPSTGCINEPDLLLVRSARGFNRLRLRSIRGPRAGNGDSVAAADHDRDGHVDVFVTNGYYEYARWVGRHKLFENRSPAGRWTAIQLRGSAWNPSGIGARIRVRTPRFTYWRFVTDGVAFRSQSEVGYVHLGLRGQAAARVRVEWQTGGRDCVLVAAGTVTKVRKGAHSCPRPARASSNPRPHESASRNAGWRTGRR